MTKIELRPITERNFDTWKELARVEYSASAAFNISGDTILPENQMRLYYGNYAKYAFMIGAYDIESSQLVGFVLGDFKTNKIGQINAIYVTLPYQRKKGLGVGKKLLEAAENIMKKDGAKEVQLESTAYAKQFYIKQGYKNKDLSFWKKLKDRT